MSKVKLLYDERSSWEKDFTQYLFNFSKEDIIYVSPEILKTKVPQEDDIIGNNILAFSSNVYSFEQIMGIVLRLKPLIIVQFSDEHGIKPEYAQLALHTKLLLRQYNFNKYWLDTYSNILQIPLGYMEGMFNNENAFNSKLKPLSERNYKWSFVGNIKNDREELINKFSNKFKQHFVGNNIASRDMFDIYNDSIFVPNGRGYVRVDCFRIYEAILSGSIPVIVCDESEFNETFYYNNDIPPFVLEKNWDDAVNRCEYLLNNFEELERIQKENYEWLKNKITSIQDEIHSILKCKYCSSTRGLLNKTQHKW
jgi:hypothetical protein